MDYLWSPWRYKYLSAPRSAPENGSQCIFCGMAQSGEDEKNLVVLRAEHNFVVLNRYPYTSGHLMVVPYPHVPDLAATDETVTAEMMLIARRAASAIQAVYRPDGMNLGMNIGESAGAGIAGHIHMHVLPRWRGDSNFMTTVGETRVLPEELSDTWRRLKQQFG